jgi:rRNA pseudouridine-1189 N-methylase Emg1 (Nep1/Mra1 family)
MLTELKPIDTIADLRSELGRIPRVRLQFAKAMSDLLASHGISISGELLGKLNIASCDELLDEDGESMTTWTN